MENITLGQIYGFMAFVAALITAGGVISKFGLKCVRKIIRSEIVPLCDNMQEEVKNIKEDNKVIHQDLIQNSLDTMRIAICSRDIPLKERVAIGERYIEKGGNGAVKALVKTLNEDYENELRKKEK